MVLKVSRGVSIVLLVVYVLYLVLQMGLQTRSGDSEAQSVKRDGHTYVALSNLDAASMGEHDALDSLESIADLPLQSLGTKSPRKPAGIQIAVPQTNKDEALLAARFPFDDRMALDIPRIQASPRSSTDSGGSEPTFQATRSSISSSSAGDSRSSLDSPYPSSPVPIDRQTSHQFLLNGPEPATAAQTGLRPLKPLPPALLTLLTATALAALTTELLVSSLPALLNPSHPNGPTKPHPNSVLIPFLILPLVGNAAELVTATRLALSNNLPLARAVALESSAQVVLLLAPLVVLVGWAHRVDMGLGFRVMQVGGVGIGLGIVSLGLLIAEGMGRGLLSGWKMGVGLFAIYGCVGAAVGVYAGR